MKKKFEEYNLRSIIVGLVLLLLGMVLDILGFTILKEDTNISISIGCSLIASGLLIFLNTFIVEKNEIDPLKEWKISKIYKFRSERNADNDDELKNAKDKIDIVAFGLKSLRNAHPKTIEKCLKKGVNIRIITMQPDSPFVKQREVEEKEVEGHIFNSIKQLIDWADSLNTKGYSGRVSIKGYSCMTLDLYWRVDNNLFVGPYWYGRESQETITYGYQEGGLGFDIYSDYFEDLWNNEDIMIQLTK